MSSVSVSCCQPPASSMAARRQTPAVPLKLKKTSAAGAAGVLEHEVAVEQNGLHLGQERIIAVDVRPARLHHADLRIGEVMNGTQQEIFGRSEIGVEDGNELAFCSLHSFGQRARFDSLRGWCGDGR